ncbi:insulin-related peptide 1-like isoform X2 [Ostrinia furnacalis]|nr:insulin-related peptide 1-like isoform X2 [Ostrinia furnacalis]
MKFQHLFAVLAFSVTISYCTGHIGGGQLLQQNEGPKMYCGRNLARMLAVLCFDEGSMGKRSESSGTMYEAILSPYYKTQDVDPDWPWMSLHKSRSLGFPSRGKRFPGVVNECCEKACSINELMTYC